jgi:tripartite-type tricarboxylate transporter receptor subunit TctC
MHRETMNHGRKHSDFSCRAHSARTASRLALCGALLALAAPMLALPAQAQTYPTKPIRLMVPFPPGGPADVSSRVVGRKLAEDLGQPIVIENQSGSGGTIAAEAVARAPADGYTLVIGSLSTLVTNPILNPNVRYDPVKSFSPVGMIAVAPSVLLVNPQVSAKSLRELIDLAKAKPGALNFGSNGTGALPHLAGELFKSMTGVDIVHVPYKGAAPATNDLVAGQIQLLFIVPSGVEAHIRSGKLRALAVASSKRLVALPDVPTSAEAGLPGFETSTWFGLCAPRGTPAAAIARLNAGMVRALAAREVTEALSKQGLDAGSSAPDEFAQFIVAETAKWSRIIKTAGIKLEN